MFAKSTPGSRALLRWFRKLAAACTCEPIDWGGDYTSREPCEACEQWWDKHSRLHRLLGLRPWQWPAYIDPRDPNPYPEESAAAEHWRTKHEQAAEQRTHMTPSVEAPNLH
jgi:hypothetical protein